ncbi:MAG TPA: ABC transporter permease [Jatrophihabitans sp.]|nr:ABC transporter permease [Jatrophihabitans sp.]
MSRTGVIDHATALTEAPRRSVLLRMLPPGLYAGRSLVMMERAGLVYRRSWMLVLSGFFEPLFYLLSFGAGLAPLVGGVHGPNGEPLTYAQYIAPALLASSAMNGAIADSTINVFQKLKFAKLYDGILATSLGPVDVALGEITWALSRGGLYAIGFVVVMVVMHLIISPWALMLIPVALLVALGFAAVGMATTTFMRNFQDLQLLYLVTLPMFLFSGTFYGLNVYPVWLRFLVELMPLQHGVVLLRSLTVGDINAGLLWHAGYFAAMAIGGLWLTSRRLTVLLLS